MDRILIAGCGYVGARLATLLVEAGRQVWGLKRSPHSLPDGVTAVAADVTDPSTLVGLPTVDAVVYAVSPSDRSVASYRAAYVHGVRNVINALDAPPIRTLLVSSTGVYGQRDGRWVDEETPPEPSTDTGAVLLEGEEVVRDQAGGVVLRLGGIYGPGRTRTVRRVLAGESGCPSPDVYGNRIHRDDAAGAARHLLAVEDAADVYLGVDREPAPLRDVYRWIADRGDAPDPCRSREGEVWEASGRRGTNKRCSSDRLAESGYVFRYPTYREGYGPLVDALAGPEGAGAEGA